MGKYKNFMWVGLFMIVAVGGLVWLANYSEDVTQNEDVKIFDENTITLFYGDGCPHCEDVDKFIEENDIKSKVTFEELEVWENKDNAKILDDAAKICELDLDRIGVPFLFARGECYVGGPDVQEFFEKETEL